MPEDVVKETPRSESRSTASPEFFFLLQRIDKLDEKLNTRIDQTEAKLSARIDQTEAKLSARIDQTEAKLSARIDQVQISIRQETKQEISSLKTTMWAAAGVILAAFGIVVAVLLNIKH